MKKIITITKIYTYGELNAQAQDNVKQWLLNDNSKNQIFSDMVDEELKESFPKSELQVQYSLNSCQGDGLNIYGELNLFDILDKLENYTDTDKHLLEKYLEKIGNPLNSLVFEINNRYCYSCKFIDKKYITEYVIDIVEALEYQEEANINAKLITKFLTDVITYFENLDREYEKIGYDYLYEIDEEEVIDICYSNQYEFLEDGTIY